MQVVNAIHISYINAIHISYINGHSSVYYGWYRQVIVGPTLSKTKLHHVLINIVNLLLSIDN